MADTSHGPKARLNAIIHNQIQADILIGVCKPGDWLPVDELCERFGASRQPVMEAARRLSSDLLVDIVPQVGCRIADYDTQSIIDYVDIFGDLEANLAELAAQRRTDAQMEALEKLTDSVMKIEESSFSNLHLSNEYHALIMEMSHSVLLSQLANKLWALGAFAVTTLARRDTSAGWLERGRNAIARLTRAIGDRDSRLARHYMSIWLTENVIEIRAQLAAEADGDAESGSSA